MLAIPRVSAAISAVVAVEGERGQRRRQASTVWQNAGRAMSVSTVEASKPVMIDQASGGQSVALENASGSRPTMVVAVVSTIGRVRRCTASATASASEAPSPRRWSITSISTMALFTTMPTSANRPSMGMKPKGISSSSRPGITPTMAKGTVSSTSPIRTKELNCISRNSSSRPMPNGAMPSTAALASPEVAAKPRQTRRVLAGRSSAATLSFHGPMTEL